MSAEKNTLHLAGYAHDTSIELECEGNNFTITVGEHLDSSSVRLDSADMLKILGWIIRVTS